ncbi:CG6978 [Drosophila busckii]|uniref:Putative inorganic phosphate cotransporter n=1 Tax=Drosophila busckii TaxID=30019 RepID=A0A0M4EX46_DROBS|nr:putative inorganic phosphate cotransporter [Drosophila busckii]ALC48205.1 CG6978 [Drosophila busckii]
MATAENKPPAPAEQQTKQQPQQQQQQKKRNYETDSEIPCCCRLRFFVTFMLFLGMANAYVMRTNMSVAIVAMVNHTAIEGKDADADADADADSHGGDFEWSYQLQGYILASFFYGYVITQIPFGFLIKNYGAKHFLGWGMLINSLVAFLVPVAARKGGPIWLCAVRLLQGLGEGPIVPCTHAMLANWIPPTERSRAGAAVYAGAQFGTIVSMPLSGLLAAHGFAGGWPSIFYVFGAASTLWCIFFLWLVDDNPQKSKRIREVERAHIVSSIWSAQSEQTLARIPLGSIFSSMAFWAIMAAHAGHNYGYETLMTMLPTYIARILHVKIKENGLLSGLPYLAMWLMALLFGFSADYLIRRNVGVTSTRKLMNSFGLYGPALCLLAVGYVQQSLAWTMVIFTIGMGLNGAIYSGFKINHLDLSPAYAGLLIAITNCTANLIGLTAPMIAGNIIHNDPSIASWRLVFLIAAIVYLVCATIYNIFGSGQRKW